MPALGPALGPAVSGLLLALKMLATDRGALVDSLAWAEDTGNELLASGEEDGAGVFWIRKARDE